MKPKKALRSLYGRKKYFPFLRQAAALFLCVSAFAFPIFADEKEDLTASLRKIIYERKSDEKIDIEGIRKLLEAGADPNGIYDKDITESFLTFLMKAADIDNVQLAQLLIEYGADPNFVPQQSEYSRSAVFFGNEEITALFISHGARFDVMDKYERSPLQKQVSDNVSSSLLILEWEQTHTPEFSANFKNRKDYLTDVLYRYLYNVKYYSPKEKTAKYTMTERLLNAGADPAALHKDGFPVAYAIVSGNNVYTSIDLFPLLIDHGAPIDAFNEYGKTALYCAIEAEKMELADLLLKLGADPNQQCKSGETALMTANSQEAIKLLLDSGADPNLRGPKGRTALHIRLLKIENQRYNDNQDRIVITALLEGGTRPADKDDAGDSALITSFRISKKKENIAYINEIVQKYASDEEIKIASAAANKMIFKENAEIVRNEKINPTISALCFPVLYGGFSVLMREEVFKNNRSENIMGPVNGALTFGAVGTVIGFFIGGASYKGRSEWSDMFGPVVAGLMGGIIGGIAGVLIGCLPPIGEAFNNNAILYYTPTGISSIIASVVIIDIWF
jgi:ankyrin repeat protein